MDEGQSLSIPLPLDPDGFLRRECPTCDRQFKWLASDENGGEPEREGGYFCPYCRVQAPGNSWWTKEQLALAENKVTREVVGPELQKFMRGLGDIGRSSGGFLKVTPGRVDLPEEADPLVENEYDMRRVDFPCHPTEPLKILSDWPGRVFCLICGTLLGDSS